MIWPWPLRLDQVVLLHAIQECAARKAKKLSGVRPVPAVSVECELDQRALDGDEVETGRRNGHSSSPIGGVSPRDGNRCMLVGKRGQSHDRRKGKPSAA